MNTSQSPTPAAAPEPNSPAVSTPPRQFVVREHLATPVGAFVMIGLIMGALFALLTPALTGYDEGQHVLRAWQISNGNIRPIEGTDSDGQRGLGDEFPSDLRAQMRQLFVDGVLPGRASQAYRHMRDAAPITPSPDHPGKFEVSSAAVYAPAPYIPSAIALRVARTLDLSLLASVLLMRAAGLVAYIAIVAFAIHRMPNRKWLLAALALAPVCIVQAATVSADGVTIALCLLTVALALRLAARAQTEISMRDLGEIALAVAALGLSKPPYFLVVSLFLPLLWRYRRSSAIARVVAAVVPGACAFVGWSAYSQSKFIPPVFSPVPGQYAYTGVDPSAQMRFVRSHPIDFVQAILRTLGRTWQSLAHDAVAQVPNWGVAGWLATFIAVATMCVLACSMRTRHTATPAPTNTGLSEELSAMRLPLIGIAVMLTGAIFLLAYTGWNQVGAPRIDAFQGRYLFVPFALVALALGRTHLGDSTQAGSSSSRLAIAPALLGGLSLVSFVAMFVHFY